MTILKMNIVIKEKSGLFGVVEDGVEVVPCCHSSAKFAIEEWECFETMNTNEEPHRRFLSRVTPIEVIKEISARYK